MLMPTHATLESLIDRTVESVEPVCGGDVAVAFKVRLAPQSDLPSVVFAKTHPNAPSGFFSTEAAGLTWLGSSNTLAVPSVVKVSDDPPWLVLQWIEPGEPANTTDESFGRGLAKLHQSGAPSFGREDRRATGSRQLPNDPCESWPDFYASCRLIPLAKLAADSEVLSTNTIKGIESIAANLGTLLGTSEPPSRLHGDLWAGNRVVGAGIMCVVMVSENQLW